jgi:group I intron endonuclease
MKYTIYKTTNTVNNKIYIGKHQTENINDSYLGSGVSLEKAVKKYGKESFVKEILYVFDNEEEMNSKEKELVTEEFIKRKDNYNKSLGGEGGSNFKGKKHTDETKQKLSEIAKKRIYSEETRNKISEGNRKRVISEETKLKLSEKAKLRFWDEKSRKKHSDLMKQHYKNISRDDSSGS